MIALWYLLILGVAAISFVATLSEANAKFQFDDVAALAKKLAAEPFRQRQPIPEFLTALSYDDYCDIRFDTKQSIWRNSGNFQIQLIHPGLYFSQAVRINLVDGGASRTLPFSRQLFTYGKNKFADRIPADLGFAGFRIAYPFFKTASLIM